MITVNEGDALSVLSNIPWNADGTRLELPWTESQ